MKTQTIEWTDANSSRHESENRINKLLKSGKTGSEKPRHVINNLSGKTHQQNTRDRRDNLRHWRQDRRNRYLGQEDVEFNKYQAQSIHKIWNIMKKNPI